MGDFSTRILGFGKTNTVALASPVRVTVESNQPQTQFVLTNLDATAILFICDTAGNEALAVFPKQSVTLETDSSFTIKSDTAGATLYVLGKLIVRGLGLGYQMKVAGGGGVVGGGGRIGGDAWHDNPPPGKFIP